jgi:hypothetical protein
MLALDDLRMAGGAPQMSVTTRLFQMRSVIESCSVKVFDTGKQPCLVTAALQA